MPKNKKREGAWGVGLKAEGPQGPGPRAQGLKADRPQGPGASRPMGPMGGTPRLSTQPVRL